MSDETNSSDLPLPTFAADEKVCGNCKLWRPHSIDERGWVGPCRIQANRGLFPPSAPVCDHWVMKGTVSLEAVPSERRAPSIRNVAPKIIRKASAKNELTLEEWNMTKDELMEIFREAAGSVDVPLANKWEGGVIRLVPGKADAQGKDIPLDTFFHKVVMVRDRLRVLEQKINAHEKLSDTEKVDMQQYITRIYGSLTSFNVLFRDKTDQFVGAKGDE